MLEAGADRPQTSRTATSIRPNTVLTRVPATCAQHAHTDAKPDRPTVLYDRGRMDLPFGRNIVGACAASARVENMALRGTTAAVHSMVMRVATKLICASI